MAFVAYRLSGYRNNGKPVITDIYGNPFMSFSCNGEDGGSEILPMTLYNAYINNDSELPEPERIDTLFLHGIHEDGTEELLKELINI